MGAVINYAGSAQSELRYLSNLCAPMCSELCTRVNIRARHVFPGCVTSDYVAAAATAATVARARERMQDRETTSNRISARALHLVFLFGAFSR